MLVTGYIYQLFAITLVSFALLFNKFNLLGLPVSTVVIGNMLLSIIISLIFYRNIIQNFNRSILKIALPIAIINSVAFITWMYAIKYLPVLALTFLFRFYIVFTLLLGVIFLKEQITFKQFIIIIISFIGALCFTYRKEIETVHIFYTLMCLVSAFCFALSSIMMFISPIKLDIKIFQFYNNVIGIIPSLFYFIYLTESKFVAPNLIQIMYLILASIFFFVSMVFVFKSFMVLPFIIANSMRACSSIIVYLITLPFFPEKLTLINIIGGVLIILPLTLLVISSKKN